MYETNALCTIRFAPATDNMQQATKGGRAADAALKYESHVPAIPFKSN
jgi:hypothetical protein